MINMTNWLTYVAWIVAMHRSFVSIYHLAKATLYSLDAQWLFALFSKENHYWCMYIVYQYTVNYQMLRNSTFPFWVSRACLRNRQKESAFGVGFRTPQQEACTSNNLGLNEQNAAIWAPSNPPSLCQPTSRWFWYPGIPSMLEISSAGNDKSAFPRFAGSLPLYRSMKSACGSSTARIEEYAAGSEEKDDDWWLFYSISNESIDGKEIIVQASNEPTSTNTIRQCPIPFKQSMKMNWRSLRGDDKDENGDGKLHVSDFKPLCSFPKPRSKQQDNG